jgi:hypothetical protein
MAGQLLTSPSGYTAGMITGLIVNDYTFRAGDYRFGFMDVIEGPNRVTQLHAGPVGGCEVPLLSATGCWIFTIGVPLAIAGALIFGQRRRRRLSHPPAGVAR